MGEQWDFTYIDQAQVYEDLSLYEDEDNRAFNRLASLADFQNKTVLEVGCGSGKYTAHMASLAGQFFALDFSMPLLEMAQAKSRNFGQVQYINANMTHIPLCDNSVDAIFSSWAFPPYGIEDESYAEVKRVLKDKGEIWLIGNWPEGTFMELRDEESARIEWQFINWHKSKGIEVVEIVDSNFAFPTLEHAERVLGYILGQLALDYLARHPDPRIAHKIAIEHGRVDKKG